MKKKGAPRLRLVMLPAAAAVFKIIKIATGCGGGDDDEDGAHKAAAARCSAHSKAVLRHRKSSFPERKVLTKSAAAAIQWQVFARGGPSRDLRGQLSPSLRERER